MVVILVTTMQWSAPWTERSRATAHDRVAVVSCDRTWASSGGHEMQRVAVAQVVDTLGLGGLERVAVTLANGLAARGYDSHLIATRAEGEFRDRVSDDVKVYCAHRRSRWDLRGMARLARYIERERLDVVQALGQAATVGAV